MSRYRSLFLHLRLNWQLMLMPIFLWGFFLSGGEVGFDFWLGLFVFHVMFYGGSVAFNSYYDRDEGPIGGLWHPPEPTRELLIFSLLIQLVGLGLMPLINLPILVLALGMFALSTAYSHPAVRLKSHPWASLLTVSLGQGVGGAAAGWLCGVDDWTTLLSTRGVLGLMTSALFTTGFYPLTQLYQRDEDRRRGDITFAVRWGERTFLFSIACMLAAAVGGAWVLWDFASPLEAVLAAGGLLVLAGAVYGWWQSFDGSHMRQNYKRMMGFGYVMSLASLAYMLWRLAGRS